MEPKVTVEKLPHHEQMEFCLSRAKYRQGRKLTAVKVYTVNDESKFLIINGVPAIKITGELDILCQKYGSIEFLHLLPEYPHEEFTEVYLLKYQVIKSARFAKKQLDGKSFYGGVLQVCYTPELESIDDTREKLQDRRMSIAALTKYQQDPSAVNPSKRKLTKPMIGRYLSRLKPELLGPMSAQNTGGNTTLPSCRSVVKGIQLRPPESISYEGYNDMPSIIPAELYAIPDELINNNITVQHPSVSAERKNTPQFSNSCNMNNNIKNKNLIPRSIKRPSKSLLTSTTKKIKVFGNKSIFSYKQNSGGGTGQV